MTFSSNVVSNAHCKYVTVCIIIYAYVYNEIGEKRYNVVHVLNNVTNLLREGTGFNICIERPKIIKNKYFNMKKRLSSRATSLRITVTHLFGTVVHTINLRSWRKIAHIFVFSDPKLS